MSDSTPYPNDVQAAFLVERIEAIVPGMKPKYILNTCRNVCGQMRTSPHSDADDPEFLASVVEDDRPSGVPARRSLQESVRMRLEGGGRTATLEQAEAVIEVIRQSGFCPIDE